MDGAIALRPTGDIQVAAPRSARAHKHGVVAFLEYLLEAGYIGLKVLIDTHIEDEIDLLVEHLWRESEHGNLTAHEAAAQGLVVVQIELVAEGRQITGHRQGGRTGPNEGHSPPIALLRYTRQQMLDLVFVIGCHPFESADGHRLVFHTAASAYRLAGSVTGPAKNPRKDVGLPVDHVGIGVTARCDQADVLGYRCVRRAGVLAIHHFVEVLGIFRIGCFHSATSFYVPP